MHTAPRVRLTRTSATTAALALVLLHDPNLSGCEAMLIFVWKEVLSYSTAYITREAWVSANNDHVAVHCRDVPSVTGRALRRDVGNDIVPRAVSQLLGSDAAAECRLPIVAR